LQALSARNAELEAQRYNNPVVWALAALALLGLGAAVWLWLRQRSAARAPDKAPEWWTPEPAADAGVDSEMGHGSDLTTLKSPLVRHVGADGKPLAVSKVTLPSARGAEASGTAAAPAAAADTQAPLSQPASLGQPERREFLPSLMGVSRSVAAEELLDVQQQADFFVSLGDDEQAIRILRTHIAESAEPSPICYLDLFKIFHKLGRQDEYTALREEFNQVFNAAVPSFDEFMVQGRGLEAFPSALAEISAHWPQPHVLDVIEQFLFRTPGQAEVFDLDAYRELLMLYGVAKEIIGTQAVAELPSLDDDPVGRRAALAVGGAAGVGVAATTAMGLTLEPIPTGGASTWDTSRVDTGLGQSSTAETTASAAGAQAGGESSQESNKEPGKKDLDIDLDFL
jgi:hypothetical protein